jgi:hypothetical protein
MKKIIAQIIISNIKLNQFILKNCEYSGNESICINQVNGYPKPLKPNKFWFWKKPDSNVKIIPTNNEIYIIL